MRRFKEKLAGIILLSAFTVLSCSRNNIPEQSLKNLTGETILEWNEMAYLAFDGPAYQHSLMASRINAMVHIAMHDALNAIEPTFTSYTFQGRDALADPITAASTAAYEILLHEIPQKKAMLDSGLAASLINIPAGDAKERGIVIGKQAAQALLALRNNDGAGDNPIAQIPVTDVAGKYQVVPPFNFVFAPFWENVKLFGLQSKSQFRPDAPPSLNSAQYAQDFNEVKSIGQLQSTTRTADQSAYAKFWYEFSEAGWNRVAKTLVTNKQLNLVETARLFALVDMALADAYIAGWDAKFAYDFWRPFTAIRNGDKDGNQLTTADAAWEPSEPTPPVQDYPSTHSALGNAAATVLVRLMGNNNAFSMTSPTAPAENAQRSYSTIYQAADENASSRVMAGIHFRFSCTAGQQLGNQIGNWIVDNHLRPLK
jgi:hypothetical protein